MKWRLKRLAGFGIVALANDTALAQIGLGELDELPLLNAKSPDIAVGSSNDALHEPEPAPKTNPLRRRQRLALLIKDRNSLAPIIREPGIVVGVDCRTKSAALHSAAGKACGDRRERTTVWRKLGRTALPQRVIPLPTDCEVVAYPQIAFAVEHALPAGAIPATVKFQRQNPRAWRVVEVRHEWNRAKVLAVGNRIELFEQREESLGLVPGEKGDCLGRINCVGRSAPAWRCSGGEQTTACIRRHARDASRQQIGKCCEVGHGGGLATVER